MALNDLIKGFKTFPTGLAILFFRFLKIFSNNDRGKVAITTRIQLISSSLVGTMKLLAYTRFGVVIQK